LRRAARNGSVAVSGWRERGIGVGAAAGDVCTAARATEHRLVFVPGAAGDDPAGGHRRLDQETQSGTGGVADGAARCARYASACRAARAFAATKDCMVAGGFGDPDVLEIFLSGEPQLLLHVLFDG